MFSKKELKGHHILVSCENHISSWSLQIQSLIFLQTHHNSQKPSYLSRENKLFLLKISWDRDSCKWLVATYLARPIVGRPICHWDPEYQGTEREEALPKYPLVGVATTQQKGRRMSRLIHNKTRTSSLLGIHWQYWVKSIWRSINQCQSRWNTFLSSGLPSHDLTPKFACFHVSTPFYAYFCRLMQVTLMAKKCTRSRVTSLQ